MKIYHIVRLIKEQYCLEANSKEEAESLVLEGAEPIKVTMNSIKIKVLSKKSQL